MSKLGKRLIKAADEGLTMVQLKNDLEAARKHRQVAERELADCRRDLISARTMLTSVNEDRNNWLLAFKTLAKLVK